MAGSAAVMFRSHIHSFPWKSSKRHGRNAYASSKLQTNALNIGRTQILHLELIAHTQETRLQILWLCSERMRSVTWTSTPSQISSELDCMVATEYFKFFDQRWRNFRGGKGKKSAIRSKQILYKYRLIWWCEIFKSSWIKIMILKCCPSHFNYYWFNTKQKWKTVIYYNLQRNNVDCVQIYSKIQSIYLVKGSVCNKDSPEQEAQHKFRSAENFQAFSVWFWDLAAQVYDNQQFCECFYDNTLPFIWELKLKLSVLKVVSNQVIKSH